MMEWKSVGMIIPFPIWWENFSKCSSHHQPDIDVVFGRFDRSFSNGKPWVFWHLFPSWGSNPKIDTSQLSNGLPCVLAAAKRPRDSSHRAATYRKKYGEIVIQLFWGALVMVVCSGSYISHMINGRSPGSNWWRYVNVPYFWPYFVGIFPEI